MIQMHEYIAPQPEAKTALPEAQFAAFAAAVDGDGKVNDVLADSIAKSRTLFVDA